MLPAYVCVACMCICYVYVYNCRTVTGGGAETQAGADTIKLHYIVHCQDPRFLLGRVVQQVRLLWAQNRKIKIYHNSKKSSRTIRQLIFTRYRSPSLPQTASLTKLRAIYNVHRLGSASRHPPGHYGAPAAHHPSLTLQPFTQLRDI